MAHVLIHAFSQVVASMVPGGSAAHSLLSKRFTARLRLAVMSYPDSQQLEAIYARMILQVGQLYKLFEYALPAGRLHSML